MSAEPGLAGQINLLQKRLGTYRRDEWKSATNRKKIGTIAAANVVQSVRGLPHSRRGLRFPNDSDATDEGVQPGKFDFSARLPARGRQLFEIEFQPPETDEPPVASNQTRDQRAV